MSGIAVKIPTYFYFVDPSRNDEGVVSILYEINKKISREITLVVIMREKGINTASSRKPNYFEINVFCCICHILRVL